MIAERMIRALGLFAAGALSLSIALSVARPALAAEEDDTMPASAEEEAVTMPASPAEEDDAAKNAAPFYVEYSGGLTLTPNQRVLDDNATGRFIDGKTTSRPGFIVAGALGMRLHEHIRGEIQLSYRESKVDDMPLVGQLRSATGKTSLYATMANLYFDYDFGIGFVPYVGAGIGWGIFALDAHNRSTASGPLQTLIDGRDGVFVYSYLIGGTFPINDALDLTLGYRYIRTSDATVNSTIRDIGADIIGDPPVDPTDEFTRRLKTEFDAHEGVFGVRFKF